MVLSSLLMVIPYSSVNMERLKDGNVEMDTRVNKYVKKYMFIVSVKLNWINN